jgi:hypothetical protein
MGVCFKSSTLTKNKDLFPPKCKPWAPPNTWGAAQWYAVAKNFATKGELMNDIAEGTEGGQCDNFQAAFSFSQGGSSAKVLCSPLYIYIYIYIFIYTHTHTHT